MNAPLVSMIIPNWNGAKNIRELLLSLSALDYPKESMEVIVVDNASVDDSREVIRAEFERMKGEGWHALKLIENDRNLGAPAAYNQAIGGADEGCVYLLKLDNDVVLEPDCVSRLVAAAERDPGCGAVGPKVYFKGSDRELNYAGGLLEWWPFRQRIIGLGEKDSGQYDGATEQDFLHGCATLLRKSVIDAVGAFDETFYIYHDDVDLNLRIKRAGYRLLYVPEAVVWHERKATPVKGESSNRKVIEQRNLFLLLRRYARRIQRVRYHGGVIFIILKGIASRLGWKGRDKSDEAIFYLKAYREYLAYRARELLSHGKALSGPCREGERPAVERRKR